MSVDDHGLEVLKKAGEEVTPGDKSDYYIKVGLVSGGSITVNVGGSPLADINWDALDAQQTSATVETYLFYSGGLAGTLVATCTVTYTSSTKADLDTVVWT